MPIENTQYNIQEKLFELSFGDFFQEKKLAEQYFKSFQNLKDLYAVCLINQDTQLLSFIYQKYQPLFNRLNLMDLAEEIQTTIHIIKNMNAEDHLDGPASKVRNCCDLLIGQLQNHYAWLN